MTKYKLQYKDPKQQILFINFPNTQTSMFEQYCIPELLLSSTSVHDLDEQIQTIAQIKELLQVQKQTELIQKIFSKIAHQSKQPNDEENSEDQCESEFQTSIMKRNDSTVSIYSLSCDLVNFTFNHQDRLKFGNNTSKCLKEVKDKCSLQTYQYLSKIVQDNRKHSRSSKLRGKDQQKINFLEEQKLILEHQLQKEKNSIEVLNVKVQKLMRENVEISKKILQINDKEKRLLRKQEAILYQRKICGNLQKQMRQQMIKLEELYENREPKSQRSFGQNSEECGNQSNEEKEQNTSKSTIDFQCERPEIVELWKLLSKLEVVTGTVH